MSRKATAAERESWARLRALSAAFKASDGTGPALEGFKQLLTIANDRRNPAEADRACIILEDHHGVTVTLPSYERAGNVIAVDFLAGRFAAGWTPDDPDRAA